jgi:hypothetical protein
MITGWGDGDNLAGVGASTPLHIRVNSQGTLKFSLGFSGWSHLGSRSCSKDVMFLCENYAPASGEISPFCWGEILPFVFPIDDIPQWIRE